MDLTEYQGKQVFREFGIPVPDGKPASGPAKAQQIAEKLGGTVVVKAQVKVGGRGKAGGVKLAKTPEETAEVAKQILGMDIKGHKVRQVLIERAGDIAAEYYASFMLDRGAKAYLGMCSAKGGMDIEQVAAEEPEYLAKVHIDPLVGIKQFHLNEMMSFGKIPREHQKAVGGLLEKLYRCFVGADAALVEVNPLVITSAGDAIALDAKVSLDENALYRHPDFAKLVDNRDLPKQERAAKDLGLGNFVALDGYVGVIGNGAGLTMSTLDVVAEAGGKPANFLDIGGGANAEVMANAIGVILSDRKVKSLMVNIFGGITRGDEVAKGILAAIDKLGDVKVPIVVRLDGTNAVEGREILQKANHPKIVPAATMLDAAAKAVELAKKRKAS
ncbi:MAG TPA: ADP-forming succinate--CoA ligase subunit beta [Actinomycetota bacterium]|nr:ADP-forming succinate--CoA ligase subunit beta [Actinomycetota bacterium]